MASIVHKKRHTKPCIYFQTDQCPFSPNECDFSHVYDSHALNGPEALRSKYRTKPCRYYVSGSCTQGMWCRFKHPVDPPLREVSEEELAELAERLDVRDVDSQIKRVRENHPKYKTRPCRDWLLGKCFRGSSCSYLHPTASPNNQSPGTAVAPTYTSYPSFPPPPMQNVSYESYSSSSEEQADSDTAASSVSPSTPSEHSENLDHSVFSMRQQEHTLPKTPPPHSAYSPHVVLYGSPHSPPAMYTTSMPMGMGGAYSPFYPPLSPLSPPNTGMTSNRRQSSPYRKKVCKFYENGIACLDGDRCTYPHDQAVRPSSFRSQHAEEISITQRSSRTPLPTKPPSAIDAQRSNNFYPITWRVIGGGVKIGSSKVESTEPSVESAPSALSGNPADPSLHAVRVQRQDHINTHPRNIDLSAMGSLSLNDATRAKSTPSSPTSGHIDLPKLYAAELP